MADAKIFADLKKDHDFHRRLIDQISGTDDQAALKALSEQFRTEVTAHAAAEEESLYATMLAKPDLREEAQHSVAEHKKIDDDLEEMARHPVGSSAWKEAFQKMTKCYLHHIDEEEDEMFPAAAEGLSSEEERRIAAVFERRKPAELKRAEQQEV